MIQFVNGNKIKIPRDYSSIASIKYRLTRVDRRTDQVQCAYTRDKKTEDIFIHRGMLNIFLKMGLIRSEDVDWISDKNNLWNFSKPCYPEDFWDTLLPNIKLRPEQILAVVRCLESKRGLIQAATGMGKSIIICALVKAFERILGELPSILILVPTRYLVEDMVSKMNGFGIPAVDYADCRGDVSGVVVCHPKSICNDLDCEKIDLSGVKIVISDEAHHLQSQTFSRVFEAAENSEIVLGFSASMIDSFKLPIETHLDRLTIDELRMVSVTGQILLNVPTSFYADGDVLAKSCVIRIYHKIEEPVDDLRNWHQLRSIQLESQARTLKMAQVAAIFSKFGLKTLILVNTHDHGYRLLKMLSDYGLREISACSYGSSKFYQYDEEGTLVQLPKDSMEKFKTGELKILIGSSHIYEGVDIPNLDSVIMGVVGKSSRRIIQGVGRSLRRTKNGKFAYIVDFTDNDNGILGYHSSKRSHIYKEIIGVSEENYKDGVKISELQDLLIKIEKN